jgi:integrase/recombinase XerD
MSSFHDHVAGYLKARRALGFKLEYPGILLTQFASYLEVAGARTLTVELAVDFAGRPKGVAPLHLAHRLGALRGFARYLKTIDPATEVPPAGIWPTRQVRPAPYIWAEEDVARLLDAANGLQPRLKALTLGTLFGLLASSGQRVGEALGLATGDVDLGPGLLTIRNAKFGRERYVPLHSTTTAALRRYAEQRDALVPGPAKAFFVLGCKGPLSYGPVQAAFRGLTTALGLRTAETRPRIHDLRHTFVTRTVLAWHRAGLDISSRLALLSNYLGHTSIQGTYWYFSAVPELMELAMGYTDGHPGVLG